MIAIVHNIPIHYKHLLFTGLQQLGLKFHVFFVAASMQTRQPFPVATAVYNHSILWPGDFEDRPGWRLAFRIWGMLQRMRPEMVVVTGYADQCLWAAWLWALVHRRPIVIWFESNQFDYPRHALKEAVKRAFVSRCTLGCTYGESNKDYLVALGLPRDRVVSGLAVVDVGGLQGGTAKTNGESSIRTLLSVGRSISVKNYPFLIDSFAAYIRSNPATSLRLKIVGGGPEHEKLREMVRKYGLEEMIAIHDAVLPNEVKQFYYAADYFVLPSVKDTWGLVVAEAMVCGLPVLVSNRCGCSRDLVTEDTGWTFSPYNTGELQALFAKIEAMPEPRRKQMSEAARTLSAKYHPAKVAARIKSTLCMVAGIL